MSEETSKKYGLRQYFTARNAQYVLLAFSLLVAIHLNWEIENIIFFCFLVWSVLNSHPSSFYAKSSMILIVFIPFLLSINKASAAEHFAYFGFYLLLLAVAIMIWENYLENKRLRSEK